MISTRQLVIFEGTDDKPAIHQPLGQLLGSSVRCIANLGLHVGRYTLSPGRTGADVHNLF